MRKLQAILLSVVLLNAAPCIAGTSGSAAKTREFHEAYAAFNANNLQRAYKILTAFVAKTPAYDAVGLLGQTELLLGKYRDAAEHLTMAIQNTPSSKAEDALPVLKQDLAQAKTHITTLRITVDQPDAEVSIDGKTLPRSSLDTDHFVEPGKHLVTAIDATLGSTESSIDSRAGETSTISLRLAKPSNTPAPPNTAADTPPLAPKYTPADLDKPSKIPVNEPPTVEPKRGVETKTIVLIAGGAVTLLAAGTATYFGLKARSLGNDAEPIRQQIEDSYGKNGCVSAAGASSGLCNDLQGKLDDQGAAGRTANVFFAVAGVAAVATGLTYLSWPDSKAPTSAFAMAPVVAPGAGGLIFQGNL